MSDNAQQPPGKKPPDNGASNGGDANARSPSAAGVTYAAYFTSSTGKRFYARDYGHRCWPIGKSRK